MMSSGEGISLVEYFGSLEDPRRPQGRRHNLLDIIAMTICAVVAGAEGWDDIELFARYKVHWFSRFLELPNGIPCSDTFARVFARIDPDRFRNCFMEWVSGVHRLTQGQVIAVDGKTLRRSHNRRAGKEAIHLVSAWASENSLVLGQTRTEAKSNEITAIPELLRLLDVSGCIVTIDAMGCQKEIAQTILDRGADYLLAVKENQGRLYEDIRDLVEGAAEAGYEGVGTLRLRHHPEQGAWAHREKGRMGDKRPSLPGVSEYRAGLAWVAVGSPRGGPARHGQHHHGAVPLLHLQPGIGGPAALGGDAKSLGH